MNDRFRGIMNDVLRDNVNSTRDRATWQGANAIERATFGRIFSAIEAVLGVLALLGCFLISSATQDARFLTYICGALWLIPFIAGGVLLARFQHRLFVRVRGILSSFLGGH